MTATIEQTGIFVTPRDAVDPSHPVAVASGRCLHDLHGLRAAEGAETAQIEAMAMFHAAVAFLRPVVGPGGVRGMWEFAEAEGKRIEDRDAATRQIGQNRAAAAVKRKATR